MKIRRISIQLCVSVSRIVTLFETIFATDLTVLVTLFETFFATDLTVLDAFGVLISCRLKPRKVRVVPKVEQCLIEN